MISKASVIGALLMLLASPAFAQGDAPPPGGKVSITGDSFVVDDTNHQAVFTGNVEVTQASLNLTADKVVAIYGAGGTTQMKSFDATGHVKIVTKGQTATGDEATFDPATRVLTLTGDVAVVSSTGSVRGGSLVIDLKTNTSHFTGGGKAGGGRVTGVFSSQ